MNPMMPQGGAPEGTPQNAPQEAQWTPQRGTPTDDLDTLRAHFDKLKSAETLIKHSREVMDGLMKMGSSITPEDVVKGASKIVSAGVTPDAMAGLLAEMPMQTELLAGFVEQQDMGLRQREAQLEEMLKSVRGAMGATAMSQLMNAPEGRTPMPADAGPAHAIPPSMAPGGPDA